MDLFGRKARIELAVSETALSIAQTDNAALLKLIDAARAIVSHKDRQIQARQLEIAELRGVIQILKAPPEVPAIASQPLYLNEQEEDIQYAFDNELIDKATYEDMLKQLEFDNTEITFDSF